MFRKVWIAIVFVLIGLASTEAQQFRSIETDNLTILDIDRQLLANGDLIMTTNIRALAGPGRTIASLLVTVNSLRNSGSVDAPMIMRDLDGSAVIDQRTEVLGLQDYLDDVLVIFEDYCNKVVNEADRVKIEVQVHMITNDSNDDFYLLHVDNLFDVPQDFCADAV
jgi:hypothetical protein